MGGLGHDFKAGVNYINEPKLYVTFNSGSTDYAYTHLDNNINGPISGVSPEQGRRRGEPADEAVSACTSRTTGALTNRLTLNAGLRYDLVTGFAIDQSSVTNFDKLQAARPVGALQRRGRLRGVRAVEQGGLQQHPAAHRRRVGRVRRPAGTSFRAGWGIYYDFGYTNANILFPGLSAQGGSGVIVHGDQHRRDQEPGRQLLHLRPADQQHRVAEPGEPGRAVLQLERGGAARQAAVHEPVLGRLVARARRRRRSSTSTTSTSRARTSASAGRSTPSRRPARAGTRRSDSARRTRR